jgi:G3E family GTPase
VIPLSLVTGFLGSGKTSLLQHIVAANPHRRLVYVVNECGTVDIDGRLLQLDRDRLVRIPGGSIFCRCLAGEFVDWLTRIPTQPDAGGGAVEGVVVEASGIANPKVVRQMLRETGLDRTYDLRMIIAVVDPGSFLKLIHTLPNIIAQIEAADLVLINKIDLYDEPTLAQTEQEIRTINARVKAVRTRHGRIDFDILAESLAQPLEGRYAGCLDPNYSVTTVSAAAPIDVARLAADLEGLGDKVYRVKGFVSSLAGCVYIDLAAGRLTVQPAAASVSGSLVFIAQPQAQPAIDRIAADLRGGKYSSRSG